MENLLIEQSVIPINRPTLTEWIMKHNVSYCVCSSNYAVARAIESLHKDDEEKNINRT